MSEEIFILCQDDLGNYEIRYDNNVYHFLYEVAPILNEQQATIRKLQDLCGESDSENAKLRIENKRLEEENEKLRKELDDE